MTPLDWALGEDTGTSSKTICAVMTGSNVVRVGVPADPGDFGRCYRLLALFPEWRTRLNDVSTQYPEWIGLVREWDALTTLYRDEIAMETGKAPRLYKRMRELIDEGRFYAGWTQPTPGCWHGPKRQREIQIGGGTLTFEF